jgi:hypothetical protein
LVFGGGIGFALEHTEMSQPTVTFDRLRWWIVAAVLGAAVISAVSLASDVAATDVVSIEEAVAR